MGKDMFSHITGILLVVYIGWIFIAGEPTVRMDRACRPVEWTGNMAVSLAALTYPSGQRKTQLAFENMDYGCEYSLWRLFYESDYLKNQAGAGLDAPKQSEPIAPPAEQPSESAAQ